MDTPQANVYVVQSGIDVKAIAIKGLLFLFVGAMCYSVFEVMHSMWAADRMPR